LEFNSKELTSLIPAINETLAYSKDKYNIDITTACIGAPGVVSESSGYAKLTNVTWDVSRDMILNKTLLESVFVVNDFQIIGYGINLLQSSNEKDIFTIRSEKPSFGIKSTKAIIGAGTGLGKCICTYDENFNAYIPIPSEGGHGDLPIYDEEEKELVDFVKNIRNISQPLTYEEVLSGRGLENIYLYLRDKNKVTESNFLKEIDDSDEKSPLISKYKNVDETCKKTFELFTKFYARCAKNFVLDTMATGGLYIAGGIASKNKEIFASNDFVKEFEKAYRRSNVLKETPIYVIVNYDVSLYGACFAAMYYLMK
jgi:glucokinase